MSRDLSPTERSQAADLLRYALAVEAERQQIRAGNYHFDGIGKPSDL